MSKKLTYAEVLERMADKCGVASEEIQELKTHMGAEFREALEKDGSVHLNGFGTFYKKWSDPREDINPKTGKKIQVEGQNHISFRPDASVRRRINKEYENLKVSAQAANHAKKIKIPVWIYAALVVSAIVVGGLLLNTREVNEDIEVAENIIVVKEVPVHEVVVVTQQVEVVREIAVVKEVPVLVEDKPAPEPAVVQASGPEDLVNFVNDLPEAQTKPPAAVHSSGPADLVDFIQDLPEAKTAPPAAAQSSGPADLVDFINDLPDAKTQAPVASGSAIDADIAEAQAGIAKAAYEDSLAEANLAEAKLKRALTTSDAVSNEEMERLVKNAEKTKKKASEDLAAYMKAEQLAEDAVTAVGKY